MDLCFMKGRINVRKCKLLRHGAVLAVGRVLHEPCFTLSLVFFSLLNVVNRGGSGGFFSFQLRKSNEINVNLHILSRKAKVLLHGKMFSFFAKKKKRFPRILCRFIMTTIYRRV